MTSDPLLLRHKMIGLSQEDLTRQVVALLAAQTALNGDGLERKLVQADRHMPTAALTDGDKGLAGCRPLEHEYSIGEYIAKVHLRPDTTGPDSQPN